ncbi:unnamed protein product [Durusdinium trenchii]|uniref:Non-specific serine/threonine protein kinase n=1 Tax=Durusdinium trenchii TaxID=1381693 RepID=A0ABP0NQ99_9DINO
MSQVDVGCRVSLEDAGFEVVCQAFTQALKEGKQRPGCVKLCFVGHARAGKTSTLKALADKPFDTQQRSTHGVETFVLSNELLQISKPESVAAGSTATPWGVLEGSSVRELLSKGVAKRLAQQLKDQSQKEARQETPETRQSSISRSSSRQFKEESGSHFSDFSEMQEIIKMPMDLVAKAMNQTGPEDPEQVVLQTWDFAGQEMYYSMAHVFITAPGIYVLVVDLSQWLEAVTKPASVYSCGLPVELSDSLDFWLAAVLVHAPDARLVIVGTHDDLVPPHLSCLVRGRVNEYLQKRLDNPVFHSRLYVNEEEQLLFFPVDNSRSSESSKKGLARLRRILDQLALEQAEDAGWIPTRWAQFYTVIASSDWRPFVTLEELTSKAAHFGINCQELESCLRLFHGLGQLLHFPGSPAVVLDPQWLLEAMAQVVGCPRVMQGNSHQATALLQKGELSRELLHKLWDKEKFHGQEATLRAFLEHFSLLVPVAGSTLSSPSHWLVPSLLPKRRSGPAQSDQVAQAALFFDFHGALRQLLPSLLPRLFGRLQLKHETLRGKMLCQDFLAFSMGSVFVTLELIHLEPCETLKLTVTASEETQVNHQVMSHVFELVSEGLSSCVPKLCFSTKVPCPQCPGLSGAPRHLLDLSDVLSELQLFCAASQSVFSERSLPAYLRAWRAFQLESEKGSDVPIGEQSCSSLENLGDAIFQLDFLYSSPLVYGRQPLAALDTMSELQALQGIAGLSPRVEVATFESLQDALLRKAELPTVLHLSAHIGSPMPPAKPLLLLEDQSGIAHALSEDALAAMASWEAEPYSAGTASWLFVFLACGSEQMVEHLMHTAGLRHAICCSGDVLDAAARVFCRAFYKALAAGKSVLESHSMAQSSVLHSANLGIRQEAEKFRYVVADRSPARSKAAPTALRKKSTSWTLPPPWPRVEDYASCRLIDSCRIAHAFRDRRVVVILGEQGMGKTAMCREFCGHFSAPGRLFADRVVLLDEADFKSTEMVPDKLKYVSSVIFKKIDEKVVQSGLNSSTSMVEALHQLDRLGFWLLVVDGLSEIADLGPEIILSLDSVLSTSGAMKLLLTSRTRPSLERAGSGGGFRAGKAVELPVSPLPPTAAAELFFRRAKRPLYPQDFDSVVTVTQPLQYEPSILERLAASPLLHILGGIPGRLADAAALVNSELNSLLQHPALPADWNIVDSADAMDLELQPVGP